MPLTHTLKVCYLSHLSLLSSRDIYRDCRDIYRDCRDIYKDCCCH